MQKRFKVLIALLAILLTIGAVIAIVLVFTLKEKESVENDIVPKVTIKNGDIKGVALQTLFRKKSFYSFRGIPFAQPPINELRFVKPLPIENWNGTLDATNYKDQCIQMTGSTGSEDCLYINVFTPTLTDSKLPVMVWIYGGAFVMGGATTYGPDTFLDEDVILVTFNYRVGIFGFMSTEDEVVPGNAGIKDQVLALQWVKENIVSFGGDPNKVTIFGESAGAASVSYLLQVPQTKGLYRAAIMQSGTSLNLWSLCRNKINALHATASALNITFINSIDLVDQLRQIDGKQLAESSIVAQATAMVLDNPFNGLQFSPSLEFTSKEAVIVGRSYEMLSKGEFNNVPILMGVNSEEALMFYSALDLLLVYVNSYFLLPSRFVPISMHIDDAGTLTDVGRMIRNKYFTLLALNSTLLKEEVTTFISEHQFERPIHKAAQLYSKYTDVYYYRYSYYENNNFTLIPGAGHATELDHLFNQRHKPISEKMLKLWSNFAKYLNPTPEVDAALDNTVWDKFDQNEKYLNIDEILSVHSNLDEPINENFKFWDDLFERYGRNIDTY